MARKNIHMDDLLARGISAIRHAARRPSETDTINRLLEGAIEEVEERKGFVYLARSSNRDFLGLVKIGYSASPWQRMKSLSLETKGDVEALEILSGSRLLEMAAHVRWATQWVRGEWFSDTKELRAWFAGHPQRVDVSADIAVKKAAAGYPAFLTDKQRSEISEIIDRSGLKLDDFRESEIAEIARAIVARDAAREVYNATVRKLKSRAEARRNRGDAGLTIAEARRLLRAAKGDKE